MRFGLDVVRDEARAPIRCDRAGDCHGTLVVSIVGIEQCEDRTRIPEDTARHRSRIPCLSRAPGIFPPPRPAPTRRKMGWSSVSAGTPADGGRRVRVCVASAGTSRRPARRTLGSSPRWMRRHTVERDTPRARLASSMVSRCCGTIQSYHRSSHRLIVSAHRVRRSLQSSPRSCRRDGGIPQPGGAQADDRAEVSPRGSGRMAAHPKFAGRRFRRRQTGAVSARHGPPRRPRRWGGRPGLHHAGALG